MNNRIEVTEEIQNTEGYDQIFVTVIEELFTVIEENDQERIKLLMPNSRYSYNLIMEKFRDLEEEITDAMFAEALREVAGQFAPVSVSFVEHVEGDQTLICTSSINCSTPSVGDVGFVVEKRENSAVIVKIDTAEALTFWSMIMQYKKVMDAKNREAAGAQ